MKFRVRIEKDDEQIDLMYDSENGKTSLISDGLDEVDNDFMYDAMEILKEAVK